MCCYEGGHGKGTTRDEHVQSEDPEAGRGLKRKLIDRNARIGRGSKKGDSYALI